MRGLTISLLSAAAALTSGAAPASPLSAHHDTLTPTSESVIYAFTGPRTGQAPRPSVTPDGTKFYGITYEGGPADKGTVFSVTTVGKHKILHSFQGGSDGAKPYAGLLNAGGTLYGTTQSGGGTGCGGSGCGTVYAITPQGTYTVLHRFAGGTDGADPNAGVINVGGTFYGATESGCGTGCGGAGCGTIYTVTPQGGEAVLYAFHGGNDGQGPGDLTLVGNTLYGTTEAGGGATTCVANGCGTVFAVTLQGAESILYAFPDPSHGEEPLSGLLNVGNLLYGTTYGGGLGGSCNSNLGCGTVFSVSLSGAFTLLHSFTGADGQNPFAGLTLLNGTLYGAASGGDVNGAGNVFSLTPQGVVTTVYAFKGVPDGSGPLGTLLAVGSTLYGTTFFGGKSSGRYCLTYGCGTVFSLTP